MTTYPILSFTEIHQALQPNFPDLTVHQLQKPTTELLMVIYAELYCRVTNFEGDCTELPDSRRRNLQYPELYEICVRRIMLSNNMRELSKRFSMGEFELMDLLKPEVKRTQNFLSGIINFLFFKDERDSYLADLGQEKSKLLSRKEQLLAKIAEKQKVVGTFRAKANELAPEVHKMTLTKNELDKKNAELDANAKRKREDFRKSKALLEEATNELHEIQSETKDLEDELNVAKSKIQPSPAELAEEEQRLELLYSEQAALLQELKEEDNKRHEKLTAGIYFTEKSEILCRDLEHLHILLTKHKQMSRELDELREQKSEFVARLRDTERAIAAHNQQAAASRDKIKRITLQHNATETQLTQELRKLQQNNDPAMASKMAEMEILYSELEENRRLADEKAQQIERLAEALQRIKDKSEEDDKSCRELQQKLFTDVCQDFEKESEYMAQINADIHSLTTDVQQQIDKLSKVE